MWPNVANIVCPTVLGGQWTLFRVVLSIVFVQDFYFRCLGIRVQISIVGIVKQWRVLEGREHKGEGERLEEIPCHHTVAC